MTAVLWWPSWWLVIVAVLIIGNRQHALGILGHDGAHFAICSHRPTNNALARWLAFLPMGLNLEGYRRFHFAHHRDVGTPADPELTHYRVLPQWEMPLRPWRLLGQCLGDMVGGAVPHIVMALRLTKPAHWAAYLWTFVWWTVAVSALWMYGGVWLAIMVPLVWFTSLLTAQWTFTRLRIWTEHVGTASMHPTRRFAASWVVRWIFVPHNIWIHWEHHQRPGAVICPSPKGTYATTANPRSSAKRGCITR